MIRSKPFTLRALTIAMATALYACGGGGGGGGSTTQAAAPVTLSGKVSVPAALATASLQKGVGDKLLDFFITPTFAELTGITSLPGATVRVVEVDGAGAETGKVLATTTTDDFGAYSFTNSAIVPGSRYVIKVTKATTSGTIQLRAPLYGTKVNVDPGTEAVVTQVLAEIAAGAGTGVTIDNFTPSEFSGLVAMVANSGIDVSGATTVSGAVTTITTAPTLAISTITTSMNTSGDTSSTSKLGGDYNYVYKAGGFDIVGSSVTANNVAASNGSATLTSGSLVHSDATEDHTLVISVTQTGPTVSAPPPLAHGLFSSTTPYYETATHQLSVGDSFGGASTPDGNQFMITWAGSDVYSSSQQLVFAGKKMAAMPTLSGKTFHFVGLQHYMQAYSSTGATFEAEIYNGTLTYTSNSTATLNGTSNILGHDLNDTITDGPQSGIIPMTDITYSVDSTGALTMNSVQAGTGFLKGFVSGTPGNYISGLLADGLNHDAHNGIITIETATAASTTTLSGSYNTISSCTNMSDADGLPNYNGTHTLETNNGVITFDGAGNGTITYASQAAAFSANGGIALTITGMNSAVTNVPFTYTVAADGTATVTTGMSTSSGAVSANGNIIAFTEAGTGRRCIHIGLKQ